MNTLTLKERVEDEKDPKRKALLQTHIRRAEGLSGGRSFDNVRVLSVEEMGEAAGRCHMCSKQIELREDIVATTEGVRKSTHVLVHEAGHANGIYSEGFNEMLTCLKTGEPPVPAYREKTEHAEHVTNVIGIETAKKLAVQKNADDLILEEYVERRIGNVRMITRQKVQHVVEEGKRHLRIAK